MLQNFRSNVLKCYCLTDGTALHFLFDAYGNINSFIHSPSNELHSWHAVNQDFTRIL